MTETMTKEEFVRMLTILHSRTDGGDVMAAKTQEDVGADDADRWASLLCKAFGRLCVDDSDEEQVRYTNECGQLVVGQPLYALDEIDSWPEGLFEKLSGYIWWIDEEDEVSTLDAIAKTLEHVDRV